MSWKNSYLQYDDDALVVLANVGLLRRARKDVENQKVNPTDLNLGTFTSDGQCVSLDAQGIQKPLAIAQQRDAVNTFWQQFYGFNRIQPQK